MTGLNNDIDNRRPKPWNKKLLPDSLVQNANNVNFKTQLFDVIKKSVNEFAKTTYGSNDEQKYRNFVDLLMLRIKSDFECLDVKFYSFDESAIKSAVLNSFENAYDNSKAYKYEKIKQISNEILSIVENNSYKDNVKDDTNKINIDLNDRKSTSKENKANTSKQHSIASSYVNEYVDICSKCIDFIKQMSIEINSRFDSLQNLIIQQFTALNPDYYSNDVVQAVESLKSLQIGPIILANQYKMQNDKKKRKKKVKEVDIYVAGMKINSKMISGLSTEAVKTAIHTAVTVKQHYEKYSMAICTVGQYIDENLKYTDELISDAFGGGILYKLKKIAGFLIDYVENRLIKPVKDMLVKMAKDWIKSCMPEWFKHFTEVIQRFFKTAKKMFKIVFKVFRKIFNFLRKAFTKAIGWFMKPLALLKSFLLGTLRFLFKMILAVIKLAAKGTWWLMRKGGELIGKGFEKLKNSKFGKKIAEYGEKIAKPFKEFGNSIKNKVAGFKDKIVKGFQRSWEGIKTKLGKMRTGIKNFATSAKTLVKSIAGKVKDKIVQHTPKIIKTTVHWIKQKILAPKRIIQSLSTAIRNYAARKAAEKAAQKGTRGILRRLPELIGKMLKKMFRGTSKIIKFAKMLGKGFIKALPIIGWYLLIRDVIELSEELTGYPLAKKYYIDVENYKLTWPDQLILMLICDFLYTSFTDPKKIIDAINEFFKVITTGIFSLHERVQSSKLLIKFIHERDNIRKKIKNRKHIGRYGKKYLASNYVFGNTMLEKINDIDKEFDYIKTTIIGVLKTYNELAYLKNIISWHVYKIQNSDTVGVEFYEKYYDLRLQFENAVKSIVNQLLFIGFDAFLGDSSYFAWANLGTIPNEKNKYNDRELELDLMLIYRELMCALEYINNYKRLQQIEQENRRQFKFRMDAFKNTSIDIEELTKLCAEQKKSQDEFYNDLVDLKDKIKEKSNSFIIKYEDYDADENASDEDTSSVLDFNAFDKIISQPV